MLSPVEKPECMIATNGRERMENDFSLFANLYIYIYIKVEGVAIIRPCGI